MHTVAFIVVKEQHKGTNKIFCISPEWLNNAVFSKEFAVGLKLTKKIYFGVTRPMFNRVIGCKEMTWLKLETAAGSLFILKNITCVR